MIEIVQLGKEEIFLVHKLAHDIWPKAFRNIISSDQINYMLDWMYDINTLEEQVQTGHLFYVVKEDGVAKGFIGLEPNYPDIEILRIHKFYVLPECQGKGMGRVLFNLNVNRFNPSVEFYKHLGFKVVAEEDIDIGRDYFMEDYIMELNLS